ncbi:pyruvate dehydrogenase (acetyl-transferring) E1 component subunit alpha [Halobacteriales archaeon SW_5_70_135]|nr:MAG: pyruvate dehydrogenase (acetyl-transferring) E1 component subunit alpha [Halobacteriales archaeon SW_5_70_135]
MSTTRRTPDAADADHRYRYLDESGHLVEDPPAVTETTLLELYESLRFARAFDERAKSLQRQGRIATYAPMAGQAGAQVAAALAMDDEDWLYPTYRDNAAKFARGVDPADVLALLAGHEGDGDADARVMPEYIPIATQLPQAVGAAWTGLLRSGEPEYATLATLGDGATSEGDFHEGLNFAGVFDTPTVFLCQNNGWAISTPTERQTRSETLARKAAAYGVEGVRVDGMDPLATYVTVRRAVRKAKDDVAAVADEPADPEAVAAGPSGATRPTLVETVVRRFGAHTTSDDPSRYREEPDRSGDPLPRLETYLRGRGLLDDERVAAVGDRVETRLEAAVERAEARETDPTAAFEHVYAEPTPAVDDQRAELERLYEEYGDRVAGERH